MSTRITPIRALVSMLLAALLVSACTPPQADEGFTVSLEVDGIIRDIETLGPTVREVIDEAKVALDDADRVEPPEFTPLEAEMLIRVIRVTETFTISQQVMPFERKTVRNEALASGESRLLQAGSNGLRELTQRITFEDAVEVDRRIVREVVLVQPVDEVLMVGSRGALVPVPISGTLLYLSGGNPWMMAGNTAVRRPLDASGDLDGRVFSLSPDGKRLLYTRAAPVVTGTQTALLNTLWLVDTQSERARPTRLPITSVLSLSWAPSGDEFVYATAERVPQQPGWQAHNDLWLATLDEAGKVKLKRVLDGSAGGAYGWWGTSYAWAPGGRVLAFARADAVGTLALDKGTARVLAGFPTFRTYSDWVWTPAITWSADGDYLLTTLHGPPPEQVAPEDSRAFDLWALGVQGGVAMKLAPLSGMWAYPAATEERIAYLQALDPQDSAFGRYVLVVMDRDGSNRRRLFPPPEQPGLKPQRVAWSPDGREIALVHLGDLYLVDVQSGTARQLTSDGQSSTPLWSGPAGR